VGVLGPVPGLIGCLQAIEAMKLLLTTNTSRSSKNHSKLSDDDHDGPEHTFMSSSSSSSRNRGDDPHCVTIASSDTCMLPLLGRQVMYDGLSGEFHCFQLPSRDLSCKVKLRLLCECSSVGDRMTFIHIHSYIDTTCIHIHR
jgi:molybdopterin/thiamine biosynthesis adenylyltransferase